MSVETIRLFYTPEEQRKLLDAIEAKAQSQECGLGDREIFGLKISLEEAVVNAHKHAHKGNIHNAITVTYAWALGRFIVRVQDQGQGFDPSEVPNPIDPENLERPCGRGVFLIKHYTRGKAGWNEKGNAVTMPFGDAEDSDLDDLPSALQPV